MNKVTATLRLEIVKPLELSWDELGRMFRALRAPLHRVLNGAVTELEVGERSSKYAEGNTGGPDGLPLSPRTDSYRLTRDLWIAEREAARDRMSRGKGYTGDDAIVEIEPSSVTVLGLSGIAFARWQKWRKESWRGTQSIPSFKSGGPIYVASGRDNITITPSDGLSVLDVKLTKGPRVQMVVRPYGGAGFADLRHILDGEAKLGDLRIVEDDRGGKRKWQALVSYTYERESVASGRTMALHRGVKCFLTAAVAKSEDGREAWTRILETGDDIIRHKEAYRARRRSLGQQGRQLGAGAKGHGVDRRHERITRLEDAEARWVRSKCQEVAAHAMRDATQRGVSKILIEDWTNPVASKPVGENEHMDFYVRSFPLAQLRECIEWAAKRRGIEVVVVKTDYNSRTCPACGHVHETPPVKHDRLFLCSSCKLERPVDVVASWNMLRRAGFPDMHKQALATEKRKRGQIRKTTDRATKAATRCASTTSAEGCDGE